MTDQLTFLPEIILSAETAGRRNAMATRIGVAPDRIKSVRFELDVLRQNGALIDLTVTGPGLLTRTATWMELGIQDEDIRRGRLTRGQKFIFSEKDVRRVKAVVSQMRQVLDENSYQVTGIAPFRFVPFTAYEKFTALLAELIERFYAIKKDLINNYDASMKRMEDDFRQVAENAYRSILKAHGKAAGGRKIIVRMDGAEYPDMESYVAAVVSKAMSSVPSKERLEAELQADYTPAMFYGEADVAADLLAADRIRQQIALERSQTNARQREAYLQSSMLEQQAQHEDALRRLEQEEKLVKLEAMRLAEAEHARQRLQSMASPFEEVFTALRERMADDCRKILESVQKNGYVRGKVAEKGRGLLELYQLMAVHDDGQLRDLLIDLKASIGPVGSERGDDAAQRDVEAITATLGQIIHLTHTAAQDLAAGPSRFSLVEV